MIWHENWDVGWWPPKKKYKKSKTQKINFTKKQNIRYIKNSLIHKLKILFTHTVIFTIYV